MGISHGDERPDLAVVEVGPGERSKAVRARAVVWWSGGLVVCMLSALVGKVKVKVKAVVQ